MVFKQESGVNRSSDDGVPVSLSIQLWLAIDGEEEAAIMVAFNLDFLFDTSSNVTRQMLLFPHSLPNSSYFFFFCMSA